MGVGDLLTYSCAARGIHRHRRGRGFTYVDHRGERTTDPETLERSRANAVRASRWMDADERALLKFLTAITVRTPESRRIRFDR